MTDLTIPVLIVGAGPVGLTLANLLHAQGTPFRIITEETAQRPVEQSRAEGNHARTLALYERLGALSDVFAASRPLHGATLHGSGNATVLGRIVLDDPESYYPGAVIFSQARVERMLEARLTAAGVTVERGATLTTLTQDAAGVHATIQQTEGESETVTASFVVGCDGAHSVTRKQVGATFSGASSDIQYALADVSARFAGDMLSDDLHIWLSPLMIMGRIESGTWKVAAPTDPAQPLPDTPESVVGVIQEKLRSNRVAVELHSPRWTSMFRIGTRRVDAMRYRRVFLAGDAAHIHSPMGGQGMNEGMQDALNLAWKLSAVLNGDAPDTLFDSYDAERQPIIAGVLRDTSAMTRLMELESAPLVRLRDAALAAATHINALQPAIREGFTGATRHFRNAVTVADPDTDWFRPSSPHSGDRAPDADGLFANGVLTPTRLYSLWAHCHRHELLLFAGTDETEMSRAALSAQANDLEAAYRGRLRARVVTLSGSGIGNFYGDSRGDCHDRYGAASACLYLMRPDGFVGFRAATTNTDDLHLFLKAQYAWNIATVYENWLASRAAANCATA